MPLSNSERQRRWREKRKSGERKRIDVTLELDDAIKLKYLTHHWNCSRTEAVRRMILEAWKAEGEPIYGLDGKELDPE